MGLQFSFDANEAQFGEMSSDFPHASNVFHNVLIEIDEKGAEAVEQTRLDALIDLKRDKKNESTACDDFICDRPFLFVIRDIFSLEIIFIGKLMLPKRRTECL